MHLNEVYGRVKSCFRWGPDYETSGRFEYWDTFTDQVRSGVQVKRDCDDFALTVLELGIADYGWDRDKCRVARVASELCPAGASFDHAVAIYDGYVFDNRQDGPKPIEWFTHYRFYDYSPLPITEWFLYEG